MTRFPFDAPDRTDLDDEELYEVRCKYCRERGLSWEEASDEHNRKKWVLVDEDGKIHACRKAAKPSDFPLTNDH